MIGLDLEAGYREETKRDRINQRLDELRTLLLDTTLDTVKKIRFFFSHF